MTDILDFEVRGTGPGLVLIHGTGSTGPATWAPLLDALAAEHTVLLPNMPGSGDSRLPDGPLDIDVIADQIVATAAETGMERFAVAGASLGAPVAIRVAARHPERVTRLATVVGYAWARPLMRMNIELWRTLLARGDEETGKLLATLTLSDGFLASLSEEQLKRVILLGADAGPGADAQIDFALRIDVRPDLPLIRVPALIIAAVEDRFIPLAQSRELAAGIPGARLLEVGGGHSSIFEDPRQTMFPLVEFFKE
ncbi:alpha/beta fold hydrolase [Microbispora sp. RL4-1S]|uniref:Alpha/beta fold hydrolase n=1 Tax=Microbispora oryzae TaxID=2806554 RepID=A0A941AJ34_9ACTN|nr:alpha/beta fold hydrolase [Microbispora oryzae]MBP2705821.1 alpha/beta fold hydrolase [Microbispora oryzae]